MRYGKSAGVHQIDETKRRQPSQKLKSAAPGAPFGWTNEGMPYIGTQYCLRAKGDRSFQFASLSTRNGGAQYYWKPLNELSAKVALSSLETHGAVENLLAGESQIPASKIFDAAQLAAIKRVYEKLLGAERLAQFEACSDTAVDEGADMPSTSAKAAGPSAMEPEESRVVSKKRAARMALVDDLKAEAAESADGARKSTRVAPKAKAEYVD